MHSKNERQHGSTPKNKQINNNLHSVLKKKKKKKIQKPILALIK